jgi:3-hydroxyisobutyrate dehydrogenase
MAERPTVGFVGLGDMGGPMAERIAEGGFDLSVFDLRQEALDTLVAKGARAAGSAAELAKESEVVIVCLVDDRQVLGLVRGDLVHSMRDGATLVVASSVLPATILEAAELLEPAGVAVIDAPVSGSRPAAAAGTLTLMMGGDAAVIERIRPVLETFGSQLFHVGGLGAGQATKIANNVMLHMNHLVAIEAARFAREHGIDEKMLMEVTNTGTGRSWVTETWGLIDDMFVDHPQAGTPGIYGMMVKEMWHAVELGRISRTPLPLTGLGVQVSQSYMVEREKLLGIVPAQDR